MLVVDVSNVLHTTGVLPPELAGPDVAELIQLLGTSRYARQQCTLVCDGGRFHGSELLHAAGVNAEIIHAGPGQDADLVIERWLDRDTDTRRVVVVSSDRRVRRSARSRGASTLDSAEFLRQLVADRARFRPVPPRPAFATALPLDRTGTGYWMRYFGMPVESAGGSEIVPPPEAPPPVRPRPPEPLPAPPRVVASRQPAVGERLDLPPVRERPATPGSETSAGPNSSPPAGPPGLRWLDEAANLWGEPFTSDDLDMQRWLRTHPPSRSPGPTPDTPAPAKPAPAKPVQRRRGSGGPGGLDSTRSRS